MLIITPVKISTNKQKPLISFAFNTAIASAGNAQYYYHFDNKRNIDGLSFSPIKQMNLRILTFHRVSSTMPHTNFHSVLVSAYEQDSL